MPQTKANQNTKRIILFSNPAEAKMAEILQLMAEVVGTGCKVGYMGANGAEAAKPYEKYWLEWLKPYNAEMIVIDNSVEISQATKEAEKITQCDALVITGGNTFGLLSNLRNSGLDKAVLDFSTKDNFVILGFSAGALVLGPSIKLAGYEGWAFGKDSNDVNLQDLTGLNIIDFEVASHYTDQDQKILEKYQKETDNEVIAIKDNEYIFIDLEV